jgi:hypothetical protein
MNMTETSAPREQPAHKGVNEKGSQLLSPQQSHRRRAYELKENLFDANSEAAAEVTAMRLGDISRPEDGADVQHCISCISMHQHHLYH